MQRLLASLKNFFLPPSDSATWVRVLPFAILGLATFAALVAANYGWEYTNSPEFCGTSCHTMPPEYSTYLNSPHARVACVECHIGREGFATQITRKAGDIRHIILNISGNYEYPIRTVAMRPAREACETCHFPEKFSDDSLREIHQFGTDENNMLSTTYLLMSTGGGSAREGLGFGIHWHIENPVTYLAADELEQEIPYVRVEHADGSTTEYIDVASDIDTRSIAEEELIEMDCITCHNRITHTIPQPAEAVGAAISKGIISADLPFVVQESVALLDEDYATKEAGLTAMASLRQLYAEKYPDVALTQAQDIAEAATALEEIYAQYIFPDQKVNWDTHPDNLGHKDDPGCFRCHDGGHINDQKEVIRLECNVCHSIPVMSGPTDLVTQIELSSGVEPPSHTNSSWVALHGELIDRTCENCHPSVDPEIAWVELRGKPEPDASFCGNSACHSNVWDYAAFDEPALQPFLNAQLAIMLPLLEAKYYSALEIPLDEVALTFDDLLAPRLNVRCGACHSDDPSGGLDLSSYSAALQGGNSGPAIVPGDAAASVLIQIQASGKHYATLSEEEIFRIVEWIEIGAPED